MEKHIITAFAEPITDLPTEPQMTPEELKRRFQAPSEELRQAHNALAREVNGIAAGTYPDTVTEAMLSPEVRKTIAAKADKTALETAVNTLNSTKFGIFCGSYTGDNAAERVILAGFTPRVVLVMQNGRTVGGNPVCGGLAVTGQSAKYNTTRVLAIENGGFRVFQGGNAAMNAKDQSYTFFALG